MDTWPRLPTHLGPSTHIHGFSARFTCDTLRRHEKARFRLSHVSLYFYVIIIPVRNGERNKDPHVVNMPLTRISEVFCPRYICFSFFLSTLWYAFAWCLRKVTYVDTSIHMVIASGLPTIRRCIEFNRRKPRKAKLYHCIWSRLRSLV